MASINICEREGCDSFIKGKAVGGITLVLNNDPNRSGDPDTVIRQELCPACVADVHAILTIPPLTPRERSYSDPFVAGGTQDDTIDGATAEQLAALLFQKLMSAQQTAIESRDGYKPRHIAPVSDQTMVGRTLDYTD